MNENQNLLLPYVEAKLREIMRSKITQNKRSLIATINDILSDVRNDALECMRELHRTSGYKATNTLNLPALIKE